MENTTNILETPEAVRRLSRGILMAAENLGAREVRFLVEAYYRIQENREVAGHHIRAMTTSKEPHGVAQWLNDQNETLEKEIRDTLDSWTDSVPAALWAKGIVGIGPVISAGLAAHIEILRCPTVGHIWRFAGPRPDRPVAAQNEAAMERRFEAPLLEDRRILRGGSRIH